MEQPSYIEHPRSFFLHKCGAAVGSVSLLAACAAPGTQPDKPTHIADTTPHELFPSHIQRGKAFPDNGVIAFEGKTAAHTPTDTFRNLTRVVRIEAYCAGSQQLKVDFIKKDRSLTPTSIDNFDACRDEKLVKREASELH